MPWGQWGYPSEAGSVEQFKAQYPCDFICEGLDQTRGWFYTMLACSCLIAKAKMQEYENSSDEQSKTVLVQSGQLVFLQKLHLHRTWYLDHNGQKMSKSLGNVVDPMELFEKVRRGSRSLDILFFQSLERKTFR